MADERPEAANEARARHQVHALLGRARSMHTELEQASGRIEGGSAQARLAAIIANLAGAEVQLTQAALTPGHGADLASLEMLINGTERAAEAALLDAATEASGKGVEDGEVSADARRKVAGLAQELFERRIFDPYLRFTSEQEEAAYRAREAERQREIAAALAEHTPQGDHRAASLVVQQTHDAGAHGATASPDYQRTVRQAEEQEQKLRPHGQGQGAGPVTMSARAAETVRDRLQGQGVAEMQVTDAMASGDPLAAAAHLRQHSAYPIREPTLTGAAEPPALPLADGPAAAKPATGKGAEPSVAGQTIQKIAEDVDLAALGVTTTETVAAADSHGLPQEARKGPARPDGRNVS